MTIKSLPKEVLDLFPMWEYRCPKCLSFYDEVVTICVKCGTEIDTVKHRFPPRFMKDYKSMSDYAHKVLAPKLSPEQRELLFKYFTELFNDGFESGDFSAWDGTAVDAGQSLTVQGTTKHHGSYAAYMNYDGSSGGDCYCYTAFTQGATRYGRIYIYVDAHTTNGRVAVIGLYQSASGVYTHSIALNSSLELSQFWRDSEGNHSTPSETSLNLDQWHCLEILYKSHATAGEIRVWLDGTEVEDLAHTGIDTSAYQMNRINVGNDWVGYTTSGAADIYFDCVVVADTYIGPESGEPPTGAEANFETGDLSEFDDTPTNNGTITATSDVAHHGSYSCKCDVNADGNAYAEGYFNITAQQPVYCRGYFRFNQLPETNRDYTIISFENTGGPTTVGYIQLVDDGGTKKWKMRRTTGGGATYSTSTSNIPEADTWVCVEFAHGENLAKLWVDGDELLTHTDATDQTIDRVHVGACDSDIDADDTLEIHMDCIVVTENYIGPENDLILQCNMKQLTRQEIVNAIYKWDNGNWAPEGLPAFDTDSKIVFKDNAEGLYGHLFSIISTNDDPPEKDPLVVTDLGLVVQKDIAAGGFISTNQGEIWIGHGRHTSTDPPRIILMHTSPFYTDPEYDTLYLTKFNTSIPANMNLDTLHCNLIAYNDGKTRLTRMDEGVLAVQSLVGETWFAGTLDASNVFVDHINSLSAQGITILDPTLYFGIDQDTNLYRSAANTLKTDDDFVCSALTSTNINPTADNTYGLGSGSYRWQGIVAVTGYFDDVKTTAGGTYVWSLANMPNQGTNGYVLTAQGAGNAPVWAPAGGGSIPWTEVPSSINPSADNTYGIGSGSYAWQGVVAYTMYANDYYSKTGGNATFHGNVTGNANYADTAGYATPYSHSHAASDVTSGTFDLARIPSGLNSKIDWGYIGDNPTPSANNTYSLGNGSYYWLGLVANYVYYKNLSSFDALDDLALLKKYTVEKTTVKQGDEEIEVDVIAHDSLDFLKRIKENDSEEDFWDGGKVMGYLLGCLKSEVLAREKLEQTVKELITEIENQKGVA